MSSRRRDQKDCVSLVCLRRIWGYRKEDGWFCSDYLCASDLDPGASLYIYYRFFVLIYIHISIPIDHFPKRTSLCRSWATVIIWCFALSFLFPSYWNIINTESQKIKTRVASIYSDRNRERSLYIYIYTGLRSYSDCLQQKLICAILQNYLLVGRAAGA